MLNKKELESFQEESIIDYWYNNREEDLYTLNKVDKERILEITKGEDTYEKIEDELTNLPQECNKKKLLQKIEDHCDKLVNIGAYENEKFYKTGFMDGINLIIECVGGKRC